MLSMIHNNSKRIKKNSSLIDQRMFGENIDDNQNYNSEMRRFDKVQDKGDYYLIHRLN